MRFSPWLQNECMRALYRRIFFPLTEENTDKFLFFVRVPFSLWKPIGSSREIELRKSLNADEKIRAEVCDAWFDDSQKFAYTCKR